MSIPERVKTKMKEEGLSGVNKPKRTPKHLKKSHRVMAKEGDTYKFIRFGQQGVKGCLLYTSPSPRDGLLSRMPSSA